MRGNRRCLCPFIAMTDTSAQAREEPRIISFSFITGAPSGLSVAEDDSAFKFYLEMPRMADIRRGRGGCHQNADLRGVTFPVYCSLPRLIHDWSGLLYH